MIAAESESEEAANRELELRCQAVWDAWCTQHSWGESMNEDDVSPDVVVDPDRRTSVRPGMLMGQITEVAGVMKPCIIADLGETTWEALLDRIGAVEMPVEYCPTSDGIVRVRAIRPKPSGPAQ
jgi:hypothetical protein